MKPTKKNQSATEKQESRNYEYFDECVKNFEYADFVRIRSGYRGTLLSFGKGHPEKEKFLIFSEVLIPLDVAFSLKKILDEQLGEMQKDGIIKVMDDKNNSSDSGEGS